MNQINSKQTEQFIQKYFPTSTFVPFSFFLKTIRKQYSDIWSQSDNSIFNQLAEKLRILLTVQSNQLDLKVLRNKCKNNGILGTILEGMRQINNNEKNTIDQISEILPKSFGSESNDVSSVGYMMNNENIEQLKEILKNYRDGLRTNLEHEMQDRFNDLNIKIENKIKHYQKVLNRIQQKCFEAKQKLKLEMKIKQLTMYVNKLERQLDVEGNRRNSVSKRRITFDQSQSKYYDNNNKNRPTNFNLKENTNKINIRFV